MVIEIKGLKVTACHGVLPEEKLNPQLFAFDIKIETYGEGGAESDDLTKTVDYAAVSSFVSDYCKQNSFNLIERLAHGAAFGIAQKFANAQSVTVTVHKPQAPIGLPFEDVTCSAVVKKTKVILSLGSSQGEREKTLKGAIEKLNKVTGLKVLKVSDFIKSAPYGGVAKNEFINCAISATCLLTPQKLLEEIHKMEAAFKRTRDVRWGDRTLDIDIIFFGDKIIEEEGLCIPHPDYQNRPFVIEPIKQIAPNFVCPRSHKRISDM